MQLFHLPCIGASALLQKVNTEDISVELFGVNTVNAPVSAQKGVLPDAAGGGQSK